MFTLNVQHFQFWFDLRMILFHQFINPRVCIQHFVKSSMGVKIEITWSSSETLSFDIQTFLLLFFKRTVFFGKCIQSINIESNWHWSKITQNVWWQWLSVYNACHIWFVFVIQKCSHTKLFWILSNYYIVTKYAWRVF